LIVDRGPAHIAKKTRTFVESLKGKLRLSAALFTRPQSRRAGVEASESGHVGRMVVIGRDDFKRKVRSSMRQLQNDPEKIISYYQKPSLKYAA
jgi:hypothetical protein